MGTPLSDPRLGLRRSQDSPWSSELEQGLDSGAGALGGQASAATTASMSRAVAKVHSPWGQGGHQTQTFKTEAQLSALQPGFTPSENPLAQPGGSLVPMACRSPILCALSPSLNQSESQSQL